MSRVIQCDACNGIIDPNLAYELDVSIEQDSETVSTTTAEHACSKKCVRTLLMHVADSVDRSRATK